MTSFCASAWQTLSASGYVHGRPRVNIWTCSRSHVWFTDFWNGLSTRYVNIDIFVIAFQRFKLLQQHFSVWQSGQDAIPRCKITHFICFVSSIDPSAKPSLRHMSSAPSPSQLPSLWTSSASEQRLSQTESSHIVSAFECRHLHVSTIPRAHWEEQENEEWNDGKKFSSHPLFPPKANRTFLAEGVDVWVWGGGGGCTESNSKQHLLARRQEFRSLVLFSKVAPSFKTIPSHWGRRGEGREWGWGEKIFPGWLCLVFVILILVLKKVLADSAMWVILSFIYSEKSFLCFPSPRKDVLLAVIPVIFLPRHICS